MCDMYSNSLSITQHCTGPSCGQFSARTKGLTCCGMSDYN